MLISLRATATAEGHTFTVSREHRVVCTVDNDEHVVGMLSALGIKDPTALVTAAKLQGFAQVRERPGQQSARAG
jgi:hypothetical protein